MNAILIGENMGINTNLFQLKIDRKGIYARIDPPQGY
jgi:hypothetical protein